LSVRTEKFILEKLALNDEESRVNRNHFEEAEIAEARNSVVGRPAGPIVFDPQLSGALCKRRRGFQRRTILQCVLDDLAFAMSFALVSHLISIVFEAEDFRSARAGTAVRRAHFAAQVIAGSVAEHKVGVGAQRPPIDEGAQGSSHTLRNIGNFREWSCCVDRGRQQDWQSFAGCKLSGTKLAH